MSNQTSSDVMSTPRKKVSNKWDFDQGAFEVKFDFDDDDKENPSSFLKHIHKSSFSKSKKSESEAEIMKLSSTRKKSTDSK
jgi:hypothetical protein